ncbi:MAG: Rod shape-determining protein MreC, rod shape-determining protein MreC [Gammaproteobacteria bacterium]|nr:Rod shape-determining protein MreC, rod shape-determining protein MreC [Gammaproteobacteria bacterium]
MTVDHRQGHLESVRSALSVIIYPVQYLVDVPAKMTGWATESLVTHQLLLEKNERMQEEQLLLNSRLQKFNVLEAENQRLRKLLESSFKLSERVIIAELLAVDLQPFRHTIVINKGIREGVFDGQPIVDANGVMGQIIHVGPFSSTVLLITDPTHALPVQIDRNGLRAIAVGTGQSRSLQLEHLPNNADIQKGDLIVSSGLGGRFPAGYPVGTISEIVLDPAEPFAKVTVVPSAKLEQSREVLLVWPNDYARPHSEEDSFAVNL